MTSGDAYPTKKINRVIITLTSRKLAKSWAVLSYGSWVRLRYLPNANKGK